MRYSIPAILHCFLVVTWWANAFGATVSIHEIQGAGSSSPVIGNTVTIAGVVVGDFQQSNQLNGFFVQEEDADVDTDPLTSEGIFVYDNQFGVDVVVGQQVRVTGVVAEYYDETQIENVTEVVATSVITLPAAASLLLPQRVTGELERYEGMSVVFPQDLVINDNYSLGRYGQVTLSSKRHYHFTQQNDPSVTGYTDHLQVVAMDRIVLDDNNLSQNPDPVSWPGFSLSAADTVRVGDKITGLTGVLRYSYGAYMLHAVDSVNIIPDNPRSLLSSDTEGLLTVASLNTLNYFTTIDTGGSICGPIEDMECRGADSVTEFDRQRVKIIATLAGMDSDIVGLSEIENHPDDHPLIDLVDGLNALMGSGAYSYIATGPIGSDAIKVAFIYKTSTVVPVGSFKVLDSSVDANFNDGKNRPSLVQTFLQMSSAKSLTVAVNHFKSKGSDCDSIGDPDTNDGQGNCNLTRTAAANALVYWLQSDPTNSGDADSLIIGDLNAYTKEDPITAITGNGYTDLLATYPGQSSSSFVIYGESGYLDHALASASLAAKITDTVVWHINADEPKVLDYNTEYKTAGQLTSLFSSDSFRASDHDPIIVKINLFPGDINGDGKVSLLDSVVALMAVAGSATGMVRPDYVGSGADINSDECVGLAEASYILKVVAGP